MAERIYTRGSDDRINTDNQLSELLPKFPNAKVYADVMSGSKKRPELERMISECQSGDIVAFYSLDRLSRQGIHATLDYLKRIREAGAKIQSLKEPWLDFDSPCYEIIVSCLSFAAKMERDRLIERVTTSRRRGMAERGEELKDRKAIAEAPGGMNTVALRFGCTKQFVHKCRQEYKGKL